MKTITIIEWEGGLFHIDILLYKYLRGIVLKIVFYSIGYYIDEYVYI